jgi:hypothetical protein
MTYNKFLHSGNSLKLIKINKSSNVPESGLNPLIFKLIGKFNIRNK